MEKHIFKYDNSQIKKIFAENYSDEKSLQDFLEALINSEKRLLSNKIIAYKREIKTDSGRPDFVLIDSEGKIIILECKIINNEGIRRKIIAQLLDYTVYIDQIVKTKDWKYPSGTKIELNLDNSNPLLFIVSDKVHPQLHRLVTFLETKNINIKLITVNKFSLNNEFFFTITPHDSEPEQIVKSYTERLNIQIESFKEDSSLVKSILADIENNSDIAVIKPSKKRISIHIIGSSERFAIWLSQKDLRNIKSINISIPKVVFQPCSEKTYNLIIIKLKESFNLTEINFDDVFAYIELETIKTKIPELTNLIFNELE